MKKTVNPVVLSALFYAIYMFAFLLTEFTVNVRAGVLFGSASVNYIYSAGIFCTGCGYLFLSVSRKLFAEDTAGKRALVVLGVMFLITTVVFEFTESKTVFALSAACALFSFGYIGATVHYYISAALCTYRYTGRLLGLSGAAAVLLQFAVQNLLITEVAFLLSVAASVCGIVFITLRPPKDGIFDKTNYPAAPEKNPRLGVLGIMAVAVMSFIVSFNDGIITSFHAQGSINIASYGRLFFAAGLICAGFLTNIRKRNYMALTTASAMFVSAIAPLFLVSQKFYFINISLLYFYCGFYTLFLTVWFIDLAPKTSDPALWAGMGRITRCFVTCIAVIPSVILFERLGSYAVTIISCVLSIITLLFMAFSGILLPASLPAKGHVSDMAGFDEEENEKRKEFSERFGFTPRETDVFNELLDGNDSTRVISDKLYISRRMTERYFTQIFEKTGVKTRVALLILYYNENKA